MALINQYAHRCYTSLESVQSSENLSVDGISSLSSAKLDAVHINRIVRVAQHLIDIDSLQNPTPSDINLFRLVEGISNGVSKAFSDFLHLKISYSSKITPEPLIALNKAATELLILNLLYCCIPDPASLTRTKAVPISICITGSVKQPTVCIRSTGSPFPRAITDIITSGNQHILSFENTESSRQAFSISVANALAAKINATIKYTALKSGNRFSIRFNREDAGLVPLSDSSDIWFISDPAVHYTPSPRLVEDIFSDLLMMYGCEVNLDIRKNKFFKL